MTRPHGLMFHHFHDDRGHAPGQGSMSREQLAGVIEFIGKERILPAREWLRRALSGSLESDDICLTFDDNLRCQYDVALPILQEFGLTAFWFVYTSVLQGNIEPLEIYRTFRTTQFDGVESFYDAFFAAVGRSAFADEVERAMKGFDPRTYLAPYPFYTDADRRFRFVRDEVLGPARYHAIMDSMIAAAGIDVREMANNLWMNDACLLELHAQGHVVGLHSHTHPTRLAKLSPRDQSEEYSRNIEHLTAILGQLPVAMSHPCNSYDEQTLGILRRLGVRIGFRSNMDDCGHDDLTFPREDHANLIAKMRQTATAVGAP